ncbi:hypothetical protein [Achromobacter ruhlandii]|uniref:hypothetical protein n=1 Tax=Achromobacter ruhlandii TaxID=72557 RepID=UPI0007BF164F|nr:hypothetical protein [Achromobacter ruhlandii]
MPSTTTLIILTMPKGHARPGPSESDCQAQAATFDPATAPRDQQFKYAACVPVLHPKPAASANPGDNPGDNPGLQAAAVMIIIGIVVLLAVLALEKSGGAKP